MCAMYSSLPSSEGVKSSWRALDPTHMSKWQLRKWARERARQQHLADFVQERMTTQVKSLGSPTALAAHESRPVLCDEAETEGTFCSAAGNQRADGGHHTVYFSMGSDSENDERRESHAAGGELRAALYDSESLLWTLQSILDHFREDNQVVAEEQDTCEDDAAAALSQLMNVGSSVRATSSFEPREGISIAQGERGTVLNIRGDGSAALIQFKCSGCVRVPEQAWGSLEVCGEHTSFCSIVSLLPELHAAMKSSLPM